MAIDSENPSSSSRSPGSPLVLEVWRGQQLVQRAEFAEPSVTVGSGQSAMFRVSSPSISELHAVVNVEDDGSLLVLDLGGAGGLTVNGERVQNASLRPGDSFEIGDLEFRVQPLPDHQAGAITEATAPPASSPYADSYADQLHADAATDGRTMEGQRMEHPTSPSSIDFETEGSLLHEKHETDAEDVVAFVLKPSQTGPNPGDRKRTPVLEVSQMWGNVLLDTKHYGADSKEVVVGARTGHKWSFLGVDMGWVPAPLGFLLPVVAPMWSDVSAEWRSDFYVPRANLPEENDWTLFTPTGEAGQYAANVAPGWDGFGEIDGKRHTFEQLVALGKAKKNADGGYSVPVTPGLRVVMEGAGSVFFAQMATPGERIITRSGDDVDYAFLGMLGFGAFVFTTVVMLMWLRPPDRSNESVEIPDRFVELLLEKPEEQPKEKKGGNPDAGEGAKAKKEEGKVGKKEAKIEKTKGNKIEVKKLEIDRQIAESAGVLGAMADSDLNQMMGASGLSSSLTNGIGGLIGTTGTQIGSGGLGSRGGGIGGGGTAEGLGGLGTKGMGSGASGYGGGGGNLGAKGEGGIGQVGGDPIILGALDRSLIDEVIKRHMNQIRYCYQRELTKNPALGGKIVIKFTIAKDGTVSQASTKSTTMSNSAVENCIVGRFMRMQFPEPKGGGIVIVSYPFLFSPG